MWHKVYQIGLYELEVEWLLALTGKSDSGYD